MIEEVNRRKFYIFSAALGILASVLVVYFPFGILYPKELIGEEIALRLSLVTWVLTFIVILYYYLLREYATLNVENRIFCILFLTIGYSGFLSVYFLLKDWFIPYLWIVFPGRPGLPFAEQPINRVILSVIIKILTPLIIAAIILGEQKRKIFNFFIKMLAVWFILVILIPWIAYPVLRPPPKFNAWEEMGEEKIKELYKNFTIPDPEYVKEALKETNTASFVITGAEFLSEEQVQEIIEKFNTSEFKINITEKEVIIKPRENS